MLEHRTTHAVRCQCDNFRESLAFEVSEMGRMRISITVERLPEPNPDAAPPSDGAVSLLPPSPDANPIVGGR